MKRFILAAAIVAGTLGAGWAVAQTTAAAPATPAAPKARPMPMPRTGAPGPGGGMGMMGGGMGMMGGRMGMMGEGMGMCPMMMGGPDAHIDVKNVDKGVSITITSSDPSKVVRMQKMAEAMRLMHEAMMQP